MNKTLTELWYGNVIPHEHKRDYSPIRDLTELSKRNRAALVATLTPEQKELLEKYEGSADEISGFCERDSFIYGFRLGMRLAIEALADEHENPLALPHLPAQLRGETILPVFKLVGHEIRTAQEVQQIVTQRELQIIRQITAGFKEILRQLATDQLGPVLFQPCHAPGIKGLQAVRTLVGLQHLADRLRKGSLVAVFRLQLHDERRLAVIQGQHIHEFRDGFVRTFQLVILQLLRGQVLHMAGLAGGAVQQGIVDDCQIAVLQQMDIQFNTVAMLQRGLKSRHRVFRHTVSVQPPVGIGPAPESLQPGMPAAAVCAEDQDGNKNDDQF